MSAPKSVWYWHVHHAILAEPLTEPIENRIAFIKANKPEAEVETRLRLMSPVRSLPRTEARATYQEARAAYEKAYEKTWAASDKALAAYEEAWVALEKDMIPLHAEQCPDCPWDGKTIFPAKEISKT
jgi:hypothetical protein